jgi:hypothetical protein
MLMDCSLCFLHYSHVIAYNVKALIPHLLDGHYICTIHGHKISINVHGFHGLRPQEKHKGGHRVPCPLV